MPKVDQKQIDLDRLILEPSEHFERPNDVLLLNESDAMKIRILKAWENELVQLEHMDDENMPGEKSDLLQEVHNSLISLRGIS